MAKTYAGNDAAMTMGLIMAAHMVSAFMCLAVPIISSCTRPDDLLLVQLAKIYEHHSRADSSYVRSTITMLGL